MNRKQNGNSRSRDGSVREKAYVHIQQSIVRGALPAGGGISELSLAKELKSSRAPIREAMNQLAAEGLLEQHPSGGMVVAQLRREDIVELYELREALEVFAISRVACVPIRLVDKAQLQLLVDEIAGLRRDLDKSKRKALNEAQMRRFLACDLGFHSLLMSMANNSRLHKVVRDTRLLISVFAIQRAGHDRTSLKSIHRYHQKILDAVVKQDPSAAAAALAEHIQTSRAERLSDFDRQARESTLARSSASFWRTRRTAISA